MDSWKQSIPITATYYENLPHSFAIFFWLISACINFFSDIISHQVLWFAPYISRACGGGRAGRASAPPPPHVFENSKELLRKSVFSPPLPQFESLVSLPTFKVAPRSLISVTLVFDQVLEVNRYLLLLASVISGSQSPLFSFSGRLRHGSSMKS